MVQMNEMTAEDVIRLAKSAFPDNESAQVEMIKGVYREASYGGTVKDAIKDSNGASSRTATQGRTMAQPGAPGAEVGQIDDPDEIQRRFRDEDVAAEEYNKGAEAEDEKKSAKASKKAQMANDDDEDDDGQDDEDGQFLPDDEMLDSDGDGESDEDDPRKKSSAKKSTSTKKSRSVTQEEYENRTYNSLLNKGGNPDETAEVIDAAPVVQQLAEVTAEGNAQINVKLDNMGKSMRQLISLVKSQAAQIETQGAELRAVKAKVATNHNKMVDYVAKSFSTYAEPLQKSQTANTAVEEETIVKSVSPRPTMNGAIAVIGETSQMAKSSGRLSGDYKRDKKMLIKSLTAAAEAGEEGASDILAEIDLVPASFPQGFEAIVSKMPAGWMD